MSAAPRNTAPSVVLASRSPRRAQLLQLLGLPFEVLPADVDETYIRGEDPATHAERLAREKASAVSARRGHALVVGSDTVVVIQDEVLGKPRDEADAVAMLLRLQGREHTVATGIAVAWQGVVHSGVERVRVWFEPFDAIRAAAYVATGEPMDKAGAYGIQGFGAALIERIEGDFFAVMGLPIAHMLRLMRAHGWRYDFRGLVQD
jgi:septum formation protein